MLGKDLSIALSGIADDKIESAMNAYARRKARVRQGWLRVAAVAATLAILLTAALWPGKTTDGQIIADPGVMKAYACDWTEIDEMTDLDQVEMKSTNGYFAVIYDPLVNIPWEIPFAFKIPNGYFGDAEITFELSSKFESFADSIVVENGKGILLKSQLLEHSLRQIRKEIGEEGKFYLDILVRADGKLVGYGVISFCFDGLKCMAYQYETVCYPLIDGKFQEVSEGYVWRQIGEYKQLHKEDETPIYNDLIN